MNHENTQHPITKQEKKIIKFRVRLSSTLQDCDQYRKEENRTFCEPEVLLVE